MKQNDELKQRFLSAVDSFIERIKQDKNVIALILQGSLSYDQVWEKSDIDTILVVRDQPLTETSFCLNEDDIPLNVKVVQRSDLRRGWERSLDGSISHSFITTCKIVYTTDDSLYGYLDDLKRVGRDDMALALMSISGGAMVCHEKCLKWLTVKENPQYAQFWLLKAAEAVAAMIVCLNMETPNREAVLRARELNPEIMAKFYDAPMSHVMSHEEIEKALEELDEFIASSIDIYSRPMLDYLADGELRTVSQIAKHFRSNSHSIQHFMDFLYERGLVEKVSKTICITPKSRKMHEEMAYLRIIM